MIMEAIDAVRTAIRRTRQAREARRNERAAHNAYLKRCREGGHWIGGFPCFIALALAMTVSACHHETTADVIRMQRDALAECAANAARIAEEAPSLAEGERLLDAEVARCVAAGRAICEPRDTCGEVFR